MGNTLLRTDDRKRRARHPLDAEPPHHSVRHQGRKARPATPRSGTLGLAPHRGSSFGGATMSRRADAVARTIRSFVDHPVTNLVKGLVLLAIGLSDAWGTVRQDIAQRHLRIGHGLVIIGFFSLLEALPHLIESLDAGGR